MEDDDNNAEDPVAAIFARCGLPPGPARRRCRAFVSTRYPAEPASEAVPQGYCSFTLCVGAATVVQFRPPVHRLDVGVAARAREVYGRLAPLTEFLGELDVLNDEDDGVDDVKKKKKGGARVEEDVAETNGCRPSSSLLVYAMERIPGVSLADADARASTSLSRLTATRASLVKDFTHFIAAGWRAARPPEDFLDVRSKGKVGSSVRWRLEMMHARLPKRFRATAKTMLDHLDEIEALPWVLTHGDIVAANVMLDRATDGDMRLTGLLDWAEAEFLPFGVGLYGLEELLGSTLNRSFSLCESADDLRKAFWSELYSLIPELGNNNAKLRKTVELAQALGMLLWHGIAFDNGKLDRVVEVAKDDQEIHRLDLFFSRETTDTTDEEGHEGVRHITIEETGRSPLGWATWRAWACLRRFRIPDLSLWKL